MDTCTHCGDPFGNAMLLSFPDYTGAGEDAGAGFMLAFGAGTLPLLLITLTAGTRLFRITGGRVQALLTSLAVLAGLLLIWRGWRFVAPFEFQVFRDMAFPTMCH